MEKHGKVGGIQTTIRLGERLYMQISKKSKEMNISQNATMTMLMELGIKVLNASTIHLSSSDD